MVPRRIRVRLCWRRLDRNWSLFQGVVGLGLLSFEAAVTDMHVGSARSAEKSLASGPDLESLNQAVPLKPQALLKIHGSGSRAHSAEGGDASSGFGFAPRVERGSLSSLCLLLFWKSLCLENEATQKGPQVLAGFVVVVGCSRTDCCPGSAVRWLVPAGRSVLLGKNCQPSWGETGQRGGGSSSGDGEEGIKVGSSWDQAEPLLGGQQGLRSVSSPDGGEGEQQRRRELGAAGNDSRSCQSKGRCGAASPPGAMPSSSSLLPHSSSPQTFPHLPPSFPSPSATTLPNKRKKRCLKRNCCVSHGLSGEPWVGCLPACPYPSPPAPGRRGAEPLAHGAGGCWSHQRWLPPSLLLRKLLLEQMQTPNIFGL